MTSLIFRPAEGWVTEACFTQTKKSLQQESFSPVKFSFSATNSFSSFEVFASLSKHYKWKLNLPLAETCIFLAV